MSRSGSRARLGLPAAGALLALALAAALLFGFAEALSEHLTRRVVDTAKAAIATAGAGLLLLEAALRRRGQADLARGPRDLGLVVLALASGLAGWNFLQFHYGHWIHYSDTYHYYVGSKYFRELGYTRLYACAALADAEAAPEQVAPDRTLRDLASKRMITAGEVLGDPEDCRSHFRAERWGAFQGDVAWFRAKVPPARWAAIHRDHGYNPPPPWGMLGGWLANRGPASDRRILALTLLDPLLLAVAGACVAWAFGWRALCVAGIFWGTDPFGDFGWNGGGFLRQDWLAAGAIGICCLRRDRAASGGFLLGLSALLRIFPAAILAALGLRVLWCLGRDGAIAPAHRRLAAGSLAAFALVVPLSSISAGGFGAWSGFIENSRLHLATPLKNHVGLRTLLAFDAGSVDRRVRGANAVERYDAWSAARSEQFARRRPLYWSALGAFAVLLALAVRDRPDWVAAVLGVGLIPIAFELTNYYYSILLVYGFLHPRWRSVGAGLCAVAALGWAIADRWQWQDEILTWSSAVVVAFVVLCSEVVRRQPGDANG